MPFGFEAHWRNWSKDFARCRCGGAAGRQRVAGWLPRSESENTTILGRTPTGAPEKIARPILPAIYAAGVGEGSAEAGAAFGAEGAAFLIAERFLRTLGAGLVFGARALVFFGSFLDRTSPRAFLMFCTLGIEIPKDLALCEPVFPALTSVFTWMRVASVILARLWALGVPFALAFLRPRLLPIAFPRAAMNNL